MQSIASWAVYFPIRSASLRSDVVLIAFFPISSKYWGPCAPTRVSFTRNFVFCISAPFYAIHNLRLSWFSEWENNCTWVRRHHEWVSQWWWQPRSPLQQERTRGYAAALCPFLSMPFREFRVRSFARPFLEFIRAVSWSIANDRSPFGHTLPTFAPVNYCPGVCYCESSFWRIR